MVRIGDEELPKHISYSSLTSYLHCGWSYYLAKVVKVPEQSAWWFFGGSAVHKAAEDYDRMNP